MVMLIATVSSVLITVGIMFVLIKDSWEFFRDMPEKFGTIAEEFAKAGDTQRAQEYEQLARGGLAGAIWEFITSTQWTPLFETARFGILPLVSGTLVTSFVAVCLAIPVGTAISLYLSEFANEGLREVLKPILELIAGVPSVVFGYFALLAVNPPLQEIAKNYFNYELPGSNMLGAGLVLGISIIPLVSSVSEDAMRSVPNQMKEGSYAMGATRLQTATKVVIPAAFSGIVAAYILGISRAVGETMIVTIAAGNKANFTINPLEEASTISAFIVEVTRGEVEPGVRFNSLFAAGLTLAVMTLVLNGIGMWLISKYRERY
ncbi:MAG: phosphate ABC transporter permease subunit PstC [Pseudanabaenaceae cyanobacterium]